MTHDELLACVKPEYAYGKIGDALRAVIELHKPYKGDKGYTIPLGDCEECSDDIDAPYPCRTIQAIEKELK